MEAKCVVMAAIPGLVQRGKMVRRDLTYVQYGQEAWRWWCDKRGVEFVLLDEPLSGRLARTPPPIQRWQAICDRLGSRAGQVAVVDADTMIRWDTPDFFELAGDCWAAVHAGTRTWMQRSIDVYRRFFPEIQLDWKRSFNSGLVVMNDRHLPVLEELIEFYLANQTVLEAIQLAEDVGVDQTLLNYMVAKRQVDLRLLDGSFNLMHCCRLPASLRKYETGSQPLELEQIAEHLLQTESFFDFIDKAYVWHFTSAVVTRAAVMRATWHHIRSFYPLTGSPAPARAPLDAEPPRR